MKNITVVGTGYVGLSLSILLAQKNKVIALDINSKRIDKIKKKISPISDFLIEKYLEEEDLNLEATVDKQQAYKQSDYIIIATPTDYNEKTNHFDTSSVESVINDILAYNKKALIVIKSTIPIGYTELLNKKFNVNNIIFSPEFLREGKALEDNLYPSRIIIGSKNEKAKKFGDLLLACAIPDKSKIPIIFVQSSEAEAIKLFSNTYLALRIAFFNELDTFCESCDLDSKEIINGVGLDSRIGLFYNNPSFGYGGYCLPKDTKQLLASYKDIPNDIISAIVKANSTRKDFIAQSILKKNPNIIGVYRLAMKQGSDNFRSSAIIGIIERLKSYSLNVIIFEPFIIDDIFEGCDVYHDLNLFKEKSDVILSNRISDDLSDVATKVYSRDLFNIN